MAKKTTLEVNPFENEPPAPEPMLGVSGMRPATAAEHLYKFELEKFGPDATRWDGKVERGHGSLYSRMTDADKAKHAELEAAANAAAE